MNQFLCTERLLLFSRFSVLRLGSTTRTVTESPTISQIINISFSKSKFIRPLISYTMQIQRIYFHYANFCNTIGAVHSENELNKSVLPIMPISA